MDGDGEPFVKDNELDEIGDDDDSLVYIETVECPLDSLLVSAPVSKQHNSATRSRRASTMSQSSSDDLFRGDEISSKDGLRDDDRMNDFDSVPNDMMTMSQEIVIETGGQDFDTFETDLVSELDDAESLSMGEVERNSPSPSITTEVQIEVPAENSTDHPAPVGIASTKSSENLFDDDDEWNNELAAFSQYLESNMDQSPVKEDKGSGNEAATTSNQHHADHNFCQPHNLAVDEILNPTREDASMTAATSPNATEIKPKDDEEQGVSGCSNATNETGKTVVKVSEYEPTSDPAATTEPKSPTLEKSNCQELVERDSNMSIVSEDHDYLYRKLSNLNSNGLSKEMTVKCITGIKNACEEYLEDTKDKTVLLELMADEMIKLLPIPEQEKEERLAEKITKLAQRSEVEPEPEEPEEIDEAQPASSNTHDLTTIIIKEEYCFNSVPADEEIINLPMNEPIVEEVVQTDQQIAIDVGNVEMDIDPDVPNSLQSMNMLQDPTMDYLRKVEELGATISKKASDLIGDAEAQKPILKPLQSLFSSIMDKMKDLAIKLDVKRDFKDVACQVSKTDFLKLNYAAKRALLAGASDSEDESTRPSTSAGVTKKQLNVSKVGVKTTSTPSKSLMNGDAQHHNFKSEPQSQMMMMIEPEVTITEDQNGEIELNDSDLDADDFLKGPLEMNDDEQGDDDGNKSSDSEIDRLTNLTNVGKKRELREFAPVARKLPKPPKPAPVQMSELLNGHNGTVESSGGEEEEPKQITEEEFLARRNEEIKNMLLESSSSDNDEMDEYDSLSVSSEAKDSSDLDDESDSGSDSNEPLNQFLASFDRNQKLKEEAVDEAGGSMANGGEAKRTGRRKSSLDSSVGKLSTRRKKHTSDNEDSESGSECLDLSMIKAQKEKILEIEAMASPAAEEELIDDDDDEEDVAMTEVPVSKPDINKTNPTTTDDADHISLSSGSEKEDDAEQSSARRHRKIISDDQLAMTTKEAEKEEQQRLDRLSKKIESNTQLTQSTIIYKDQLILDWDQTVDKDNPVPVVVHRNVADKLKKHQVEGIQFMYQSCYGDINTVHKYPGSGCILAHCMGLGKTLQLIALLHTVIRYPKLKTHRVIVLCPKSTVLNWFDEFRRWLTGIPGDEVKLKVFCFDDTDGIDEKVSKLKQWYRSNEKRAGCLLVGYEAFRALVNYDPNKKKQTVDDAIVRRHQETIDECLLDPGADLVVCDEGHIIKNQKSAINKAVKKIKTRRRIILTGTPIQNNLTEYYCMVDFIKPSFLGTEKEFNNRYANPIKAGHYKDSTSQDIRNMKRRAFILHKKLEKIVQRKEASILKEFLPEKFEYVLFIPLSSCQEKLYELFLQRCTMGGKNGGKTLLPDYTFLRKIWTHPKVLEVAWLAAKNDKDKKATKDFAKALKRVEEGEPDDILDTGTEKNSVLDDWWRQHITAEDMRTPASSYKLQVMFDILKYCRERGEKCLIFSGFVAVLNMVEHFMQYASKFGLQPMHKGVHFYRLDGKTSKKERHQLITDFNNPDKRNVFCFLISARAGGQGINLTGANRVIILDTSWNPSSDQQNIFRIYRLGQKKPCYIYRLLAMGTMEEKVYSRSVTKQAMSFRVVDEQQIDRHFNETELSELYALTKTDFSKRETPVIPKDELLRHLLKNRPRQVFKYHEHESLLENKPDQELTEEEKKEAWAAFEYEEQAEKNRQAGMAGYMAGQGIGAYGAGFGSLYSGGYGSAGLYNGGLYDSSSAYPYYFNLFKNNPSLMSQFLGQAAGIGNPILGGEPTSLLSQLNSRNSHADTLKQFMYGGSMANAVGSSQMSGGGSNSGTGASNSSMQGNSGISNSLSVAALQEQIMRYASGMFPSMSGSPSSASSMFNNLSSSSNPISPILSNMAQLAGSTNYSSPPLPAYTGSTTSAQQSRGDSRRSPKATPPPPSFSPKNPSPLSSIRDPLSLHSVSPSSTSFTATSSLAPLAPPSPVLTNTRSQINTTTVTNPNSSQKSNKNITNDLNGSSSLSSSKRKAQQFQAQQTRSFEQAYQQRLTNATNKSGKSSPDLIVIPDDITEPVIPRDTQGLHSLHAKQKQSNKPLNIGIVYPNEPPPTVRMSLPDEISVSKIAKNQPLPPSTATVANQNSNSRIPTKTVGAPNNSVTINKVVTNQQQPGGLQIRTQLQQNLMQRPTNSAISTANRGAPVRNNNVVVHKPRPTATGGGVTSVRPMQQLQQRPSTIAGNSGSGGGGGVSITSNTAQQPTQSGAKLPNKPEVMMIPITATKDDNPLQGNPVTLLKSRSGITVTPVNSNPKNPMLTSSTAAAANNAGQIQRGITVKRPGTNLISGIPQKVARANDPLSLHNPKKH